MSITIRSAVLHEMGASKPYTESKPLTIETLQLDRPSRDEVRVEIKAAGLCHSDLSVINGSRPRQTPIALGHEAAGVVREIGEGVDNFQVGDHVVCVFIPSCGNCPPCAEGRPSLCEVGAEANTNGVLLNGERRLSMNGERVYHHVGISSFSTQIIASKHSLVKVDDSVPFEILAL